MMQPGKVPPEILQKLVFTHLGRPDPDLLLGPGIGQDASVIRIGESIIIASTDPITGSIEDIGWLALHINANDIATFGVRPRWFLTSIMLPPGSGADEVGRIMEQIDEAASELDISVAGGHTEITEGLERPIIAGFMIGIVKDGRYITSEGARPGDAILMTKTVAIEGTAIICAEGGDYLKSHLGEELVNEGKDLRCQLSVVKDGLTAFSTGHLTAMHDPTEGGLAGGVHEICDASNVGFEIVEENLAFHKSTIAVCDFLEIDPLQLISSGCMIMTCPSDTAETVLEALDAKGIQAAVIGRIVRDSSERNIRRPSGTQRLARPETDALWKALKKVKSV